MSEFPRPVAVFVSFSGAGGVERMIVNLIRGFLDLGQPVDLVLVRADGPHLDRLPPAVNLVRLVHLYYLGVYRADLFHLAHRVVWQVVMVLAVFALWYSATGYLTVTRLIHTAPTRLTPTPTATGSATAMRSAFTAPIPTIPTPNQTA